MHDASTHTPANWYQLHKRISTENDRTFMVPDIKNELFMYLHCARKKLNSKENTTISLFNYAQLCFSVKCLLVKTFSTFFASEPVLSGVFRFVISFSMFSFEHFTTVVACVTTPLVCPYMQLVVVLVAVAFVTKITNKCILPSVVFNMPLKSRLGCKCFIAMVTLQDLHLCTKQAFLYRRFHILL